jgi:hypothetical protein
MEMDHTMTTTYPGDAAVLSGAYRRAAEHDVAKALTKYFVHLDARRYEPMWDLMAPNGYWDRSGEVLDTRDRFLAAMAKRPQSLTIRHLMSNLDVEIQDESRAETSFTMVLFRYIGDAAGKPAPMTGPTAVTSWTSSLRLVEGAWKIAVLRFEILFHADAQQ